MKPEDIKKENIFKVPDGYLEHLPLRIQERIHAERPVEKVSVIRHPVFRFAVSIAALLLIFTVVFKLFLSKPSPDKLLSEVPTEALISYLESTDVSEDEILNNVNAGIVSGDLFDENDLDMNETNLSPEDIDNLLNNADTTNEYF
jgi:hypothetical protein